MKKLIMTAAIVCAVAVAKAASVGWMSTGLSTYANDKYLFFVDGQKGASIAAVTALLDAGSSADSLSLGGGTVNAGGMMMQGAAGSPYSLDAGTYTGFFVLFDSASPVAGTSKYTVLQGAAGLTQVIGAQAATATFNAGAGTAVMGEWKTYGAPEPTSGVLLLLGVAGLALKRRRA